MVEPNRHHVFQYQTPCLQRVTGVRSGTRLYCDSQEHLTMLASVQAVVGMELHGLADPWPWNQPLEPAATNAPCMLAHPLFLSSLRPHPPALPPAYAFNVYLGMEDARPEPDAGNSDPGLQDTEAASSDGPEFSGLPEEIFGIIFSKLDQPSQHRFMQASKQVAMSPSVLAQICAQTLTVTRATDSVEMLSCFPVRAHLRRLYISSRTPHGFKALQTTFLNSALERLDTRQRLSRLEHLNIQVEVKSHYQLPH